jgi:mycothiol system anti-sigma-R factor
MITCSEAMRQLWEYLDGIVDEVDREAIDEHLARCRRCCGELEFARELRGFLASAGEEEIPGQVMDRLNATLEELDSR